MAQRTKGSKGSPSGNNKPAPDSGIPTVINDETVRNDERLTDEFTREDGQVADGVRQTHPNRNVDKGRDNNDQ